MADLIEGGGSVDVGQLIGESIGVYTSLLAILVEVEEGKVAQGRTADSKDGLRGKAGVSAGVRPKATIGSKARLVAQARD